MDVGKGRDRPEVGRAPIGARPAGAEMGRRTFLKGLGRGAGLLLVAPALGGVVSGCDSERSGGGRRADGAATGAAADGAVTVGGAPLRPPAVPLAVRNPYVSSWLDGTALAGAWATGLSGGPTPFCGLVRVDGRCYQWCGQPGAAGSKVEPMAQTGLQVTPTQSIFTFEAAGVRLVASWLSPVEPGDPKLQSVPLALLSVEVASTTSAPHDVQVYCDITGQWASGVPSDRVVWQTSETRSRHWVVELASQHPFTEHDQMAAWGAAVLSTLPSGSATSYESGAASTLRAAFVGRGRLADSSDPAFRAIDDDTPAFGLAQDLGSVGAGTATARWAIGHFETPALEYLGQALQPLWTSYWPGWQAMVDDFLLSAAATEARAAALDESLTAAATKVGGPEYAALCALGLRQAYGACELVAGPAGRPWAFLKEISSDDDISTTDVIFDSCPVWLALDPDFLAMLLDPLLAYASSSGWTADYAPHALGHWPVATGNQPGAASEPMPIGDSGAMLVMAAVYASRASSSAATGFLRRYQALWSRWADMLVTQLPRPPEQLTTVDYLGTSAGNTNLAVLALAGLGAAAEMATRLGDATSASSWSSKAKSFAPRSMALAMDPSKTHLEADMGKPGTWSDLYNAYWDKVLGTDLVPSSVAALQAAYYVARLSPYGLAVEWDTPTIARVDQQLLTAAWLYEHEIGPKLVQVLARYVGHTNYLKAFPDTYDPQTGDKRSEYNWWARPVVGGVYALLLLQSG